MFFDEPTRSVLVTTCHSTQWQPRCQSTMSSHVQYTAAWLPLPGVLLLSVKMPIWCGTRQTNFIFGALWLPVAPEHILIRVSSRQLELSEMYTVASQMAKEYLSTCSAWVKVEQFCGICFKQGCRDTSVWVVVSCVWSVLSAAWLLYVVVVWTVRLASSVSHYSSLWRSAVEQSSALYISPVLNSLKCLTRSLSVSVSICLSVCGVKCLCASALDSQTCDHVKCTETANNAESPFSLPLSFFVLTRLSLAFLLPSLALAGIPSFQARRLDHCERFLHKHFSAR